MSDKINPQGFLFIITFILVWSVFSPLMAASITERESLQGLGSIVLKPMAFVSTPARIKEELPLEKLTKDIEETLRQAGLLLEREGAEVVKAKPALEIQGAITQIAANYFAYTIIVELRQQATLMRNASQPFVVTWSEGSLSTGDIQNFEARVRLLVDRFIRDYQQVNSPAPRAQPSAGTLTDL